MSKFLAVRILIVFWAVCLVWKSVRDRKYLIEFLAFPVSSLRAVLIKWCQKWWHLWGINVLIAGFGSCLISFPSISLLYNLLMVSLAVFGPFSYWAKSDWSRKSSQDASQVFRGGFKLSHAGRPTWCARARIKPRSLCSCITSGPVPPPPTQPWVSSGICLSFLPQKTLWKQQRFRIFSLVYSCCCGSIAVIWYTQS